MYPDLAKHGEVHTDQQGAKPKLSPSRSTNFSAVHNNEQFRQENSVKLH